jgi:hypothetical protein
VNKKALKNLKNTCSKYHHKLLSTVGNEKFDVLRLKEANWRGDKNTWLS